jgi:hypothetical protein
MEVRLRTLPLIIAAGSAAVATTELEPKDLRPPSATCSVIQYPSQRERPSMCEAAAKPEARRPGGQPRCRIRSL